MTYRFIAVFVSLEPVERVQLGSPVSMAPERAKRLILAGCLEPVRDEPQPDSADQRERPRRQTKADSGKRQKGRGRCTFMRWSLPRLVAPVVEPGAPDAAKAHLTIDGEAAEACATRAIV